MVLTEARLGTSLCELANAQKTEMRHEPHKDLVLSLDGENRVFPANKAVN